MPLWYLALYGNYSSVKTLKKIDENSAFLFLTYDCRPDWNGSWATYGPWAVVCPPPREPVTSYKSKQLHSVFFPPNPKRYLEISPIKTWRQQWNKTCTVKQKGLYKMTSNVCLWNKYHLKCCKIVAILRPQNKTSTLPDIGRRYMYNVQYRLNTKPELWVRRRETDAAPAWCRVEFLTGKRPSQQEPWRTTSPTCVRSVTPATGLNFSLGGFNSGEKSKKKKSLHLEYRSIAGDEERQRPSAGQWFFLRAELSALRLNGLYLARCLLQSQRTSEALHKTVNIAPRNAEEALREH